MHRAGRLTRQKGLSMSTLQHLRKIKNLTQQQLSDLSGIKLRTIRSYEWQDRDINKASIETLSALAQALGVTIDQLTERGNKMIIKVQNAYICGGQHTFLREIDENGKALATGIMGNWFAAPATDDNGNEYTVYWSLRPDFDPDTEQDHSDACDWDQPYMVLDAKGCNIVKTVQIHN